MTTSKDNEILIKDVKFWEKGMKTECPKCGAKVKPTTYGDYHCSKCLTVFQVRVKFNI